jgi:hypothetical protein
MCKPCEWSVSIRETTENRSAKTLAVVPQEPRAAHRGQQAKDVDKADTAEQFCGCTYRPEILRINPGV